MHVIGTAGHVDHGKSTLVKALTGIDPDRLKEEKARQMTIDLGFAWLTLPNEDEVGIVDVPGHIDFIKNMLAGVGGIDAVLLVIAADEGVMPQTREHLAIVDLLGVQRGIVAITKTDLVDEEWLALVREDVQDVLEGTTLAQAPIIPCSAYTGEGLDALLRVLTDMLAEIPPRPDRGRPRLSLDRVFTLAGFGTVVTGTLLDGALNVGDEVEILPKGIRGRIRGLQTHKRQRQRAVPGSRVAVNLSGIEKTQVRRGDVLVHPSTYRTTVLLDAALQTLPDLSHPLRHNEELHLFIGAAELSARLRLIGTDELAPGEKGWAQLVLSHPIVAVRGDRFILRRPSPGQTVGGGVVLNPFPRRKRKRLRPEVVALFERLASDDPTQVFLHYVEEWGPGALTDVIHQSGLDENQVYSMIPDLVREQRLVLVATQEGEARRWLAPEPGCSFPANAWVFSADRWRHTLERLRTLVETYHQEHPLRRVMPREEARSRLQGRKKWPAWVFDALVGDAQEKGWLATEGQGVRLTTHRPDFSPEQQARVDALLEEFHRHPYTPPSYEDVVKWVGADVAEALVERGILVRVSDGVVFLRETYDEMVARVRGVLEQKGEISVATVRDMFGSSRKYVLAFLEYLDAQRITRRVGDVRVLRHRTEGEKG